MLAHRLRRRGQAIAAFVASASSTTNATVYDFGTFTAPAFGILVVSVNARTAGGAGTVTLTIGGVAATIAIDRGSQNSPRAIFYREVAGGAHNVTATFSTTMARAAVMVHFIKGYRATVPVGTGTDEGTEIGSSIAVDLPAGSAAVFSSSVLLGENTGWSANVVEDADLIVEALNGYAGAHKNSVAALTAEVITTSGGSGFRALQAAIWR